MSTATTVRLGKVAIDSIPVSAEQWFWETLDGLQVDGKSHMTAKDVMSLIEDCAIEMKVPINRLPRWFRETWVLANGYGNTLFWIQGLMDGVIRGWK